MILRQIVSTKNKVSSIIYKILNLIDQTSAGMKGVNSHVKQIKQKLFSLCQQYLESSLWKELTESLIDDGYGRYKIYDNDLPNIRDLKALINMLSTVENMTASYSLYAVSLFKKMELITEYNHLKQNFDIFWATDGVLTVYYKHMKEYSLEKIIPRAIELIQKVVQLTTYDNLQKMSEYFVEMVMTLEQYPEKYERMKRQKEKGTNSNSHEENFLAKLIKITDDNLRKLYKNQYNAYFTVDKKPLSSVQPIHKNLASNTNITVVNLPDTKECPLVPLSNVLDYYPESLNNPETVKHIIKLANAIKGMNKVFEDYHAYKNAGHLSGFGSFVTFISDLRKSYAYLQEFDYQAIIAEQAKPASEFIKNALKDFNKTLKNISILADEFEIEGCIKEGVILKHVLDLISLYNEKVDKLRIPIDYAMQKNVYYKSRIQAREKKIKEFDLQINEIMLYLRFKNHYLNNIPPDIRNKILKFIETNERDICMDRSVLHNYKKSLQQPVIHGVPISRFFSRPKLTNEMNEESLLHNEFNEMLHKRQLYLEKQKSYWNDRIIALRKHIALHPYDYITEEDIKCWGYSAAIADVVKEHMNKLIKEKDELMLSMIKDDNSQIKKFNDTLLNYATTKAQEIEVFRKALSLYDDLKDVNFIVSCLQKEDCLGRQSLQLLDEIKEVINKYQSYTQPGIFIRQGM